MNELTWALGEKVFRFWSFFCPDEVVSMVDWNIEETFSLTLNRRNSVGNWEQRGKKNFKPPSEYDYHKLSFASSF